MIGIVTLIILIVFFLIGIVYLIAYLRQIDDTNKKIETVEKRHYTLLRIAAPKNNMKSPLAAEQMFSALHGIYRKSLSVQDHFSFEIAATGQSINFYVLVPTHLRDFIEGQIYSQYPTVEIEPVSDYSNVDLEGKALAGTELKLNKADIFPIKTFTNFDVDPLAGITGVLSKLSDGEMMAIQAVMSPIDESWQKEGLAYVKAIKEGKSLKPPDPLYIQLRKEGAIVLKEISKGIVSGMFSKPAEAKKEEKKANDVKLSGPEDAGLKGIESKIVKLGYGVTMRIIAVTKDPALSETRVESVVGAFKQFNTNNLNSFESSGVVTDGDFLRAYRSRNLSELAFRLNVEEIASLFHFPDSSVQTPNIAWAGSKKGEPPQNLPIEGEIPAKQLTSFGLTSFRNRGAKFGLKALDRRLHAYIVGKTGTGKSTLIENMIYDDIKEGRGVAVVDPHGELIEHVLNFIPEERIKDVVYFNPDDREYPLAFNLLESIDDDMRSIVASGLMSIFTKLWANVWSARMEYILRNAILAVLEVPDATLLSIMRLLNDETYRKYVESIITDPVVKDFFVNEYDKYEPKFRQEAIAPIQNKVGQFLSSTTIRNIVGQPKSTFDLAEIMDTGKIFLVNLSIGRIGEDNSKLLGSMMITKIQLAAMGRAKVTEDERLDFYLYVDEFQNFATDSFAVILSEARKYHLNLVLVNQYIAQIPEVVADAIFGNVGTMISFRVGATDAEKLVKEFAPVFEANDMVNLPNRQIYVKMAIDGVTSQAFSAHTLPPRGIIANHIQTIIDASRRKYAHDRDQVEKDINESTASDYRTPQDKKMEELKKYPFLINDVEYKEFSAKGGAKWYFGQPPEDEDGDPDQDLPEDTVASSVSPVTPQVPNVKTEEAKQPEPPKAPEVKYDTPIKEAQTQVVVSKPEPLAVVASDTKAPLPKPETPASLPVVAPDVDTLLPIKAPEHAQDIVAYKPTEAISIYQSNEGSVDGEPQKKKRKRKRKKKSGQFSDGTYHESREEGTVAAANGGAGNGLNSEVNGSTVPLNAQPVTNRPTMPALPHKDATATQEPRSVMSGESVLDATSSQPSMTMPSIPPVTEENRVGERDEKNNSAIEEQGETHNVNRGHQVDDWLPIDEL